MQFLLAFGGKREIIRIPGDIGVLIIGFRVMGRLMIGGSLK